MFKAMKLFFKASEQNQTADLIQKAAWRTVRAAEDRLPDAGGDARRQWSRERMVIFFPKENPEHLEDAVRAAYVNFKIEIGSFERSLPR